MQLIQRFVLTRSLQQPLGVSVAPIDPNLLPTQTWITRWRLFTMGLFAYFGSVNLSVCQVLGERNDGVECIAAFVSHSTDGYAIRCNQRERRTSRSHQHLHISAHCELEQIHLTVDAWHVCVCVWVGPHFSHNCEQAWTSCCGRFVHI